MKAKKIVLHSCMFLVLHLFYTVCNAQIEYTSISPEIKVTSPDTVGTNYYDLDLNNDGTIDFKVGAEHSKTHQFTREALDDYIVEIGADTLNMVNVGPFFEGDTINQALNFKGSDWVYCILSGHRVIGSWPHFIGSVDTYGYMALEFHDNNSVYYGWLRLKTDGRSFSIESHAWNKTPEQSIIVGQTE